MAILLLQKKGGEVGEKQLYSIMLHNSQEVVQNKKDLNSTSTQNIYRPTCMPNARQC